MRIFIDMDGVIANFEKKYRELTGRTEYEKIIWSALGNHIHTIYSVLEPMEDARHLVDECKKIAEEYNFEIFILTAIPSKGKVVLAEQHKKEWLEKYFPDLRENFRIGPYAVDKQNHCEHPTDILIDDSRLNIPQWNAKGGIGILHRNAIQSINELKEKLKK